MPKKDILENKVPRQIIGLLLKEEYSPSDLAKNIYGKKNARSGILKWLKELYKKGWIKRTDMSDITSRKKLFRAKLSIIADFDKEEEKFVELFIKRFWNPIRSDPLGSINELLLEALIIKKIYKLKKNLAGYNPEKDLEIYQKNKSKFWKDVKYRENFLDSLALKGTTTFEKKRIKGKKIPIVHIRRDFILMGLLVPDSIKNKLKGEQNIVGNPLFVAMALLEN